MKKLLVAGILGTMLTITLSAKRHRHAIVLNLTDRPSTAREDTDTTTTTTAAVNQDCDTHGPRTGAAISTGPMSRHTGTTAVASSLRAWPTARRDKRASRSKRRREGRITGKPFVAALQYVSIANRSPRV
jgi:hypothetical protein